MNLHGRTSKIGKQFNVIHSAISRSSKAYPVIETGYQEHISVIKDWLSTLSV